MLNLMTVLRVGFGPADRGCVSMFSTAPELLGGRRDLRLNLTKGLVTGRTPLDSRSLRPRTMISIWYSVVSGAMFTLSSDLTNYSLGLRIENDTRSWPMSGSDSSQTCLIGCHVGLGTSLPTIWDESVKLITQRPMKSSLCD